MPTRELPRILLAVALLGLAACGGNGGGSPPPVNDPGGNDSDGNDPGGNDPGGPPAPDATPEKITLDDITALPGETVTLAAFTVNGINRAIPISVNGERVALKYSLDGGETFIDDSRKIENGQNITLRVTAGAGFGQVETAMVTLGEVAVSFAVTTPDEPGPLELVSNAHKHFGFTWGSVPEGLVDHFVLTANRGGVEGFLDAASDIPGTQTHVALEIAAWEGAVPGTRYLLQGCTAAGHCTTWPGEVSIDSGTSSGSVAYRKDVNHFITENARYSGNGDTYPARTLKLLHDGRHLLVGVPGMSGGDGKVRFLQRNETNNWEGKQTIDAPVAGRLGRFGSAVEASGDEQWLFVGAPEEDGLGGVDSGVVHVYRRTETGAWTYHQALHAGRPNSKAGYVISSSFDGSRLAVGAPFDDLGAADASVDYGSVRIYRRSGDGYDGEATLSLAAEMGKGRSDRFGFSTSLNADGTLLAVGVVNHDFSGQDLETPTAFNTGTVMIYRNDGDAWVRAHIIKSTAMGLDKSFGQNVLLDPDGTQLFVTSLFGTTADRRRVGSVEVFDGAQDWTFKQSLVPARANTIGAFGMSLSLSRTGTRLAVSSHLENGGESGIHLASAVGGETQVNNSGAVYVFERRDGAWLPGVYLKSPFPDEDDHYGGSLSLSGDGKTLAVGVPLEDGKGGTEDGVPVGPDNNDMPNSGAIFIY